jgi:hypothetical protein
MLKDKKLVYSRALVPKYSKVYKYIISAFAVVAILLFLLFSLINMRIDDYETDSYGSNNYEFDSVFVLNDRLL